MTRAVLMTGEAAEAEDMRKIQEAWADYLRQAKRTRASGLRFGELCYAMQRRYSAQGRTGEGLRAKWHAAGIPPSTAYRWIRRYKATQLITEFPEPQTVEPEREAPSAETVEYEDAPEDQGTQKKAGPWTISAVIGESATDAADSFAAAVRREYESRLRSVGRAEQFEFRQQVGKFLQEFIDEVRMTVH